MKISKDQIKEIFVHGIFVLPIVMYAIIAHLKGYLCEIRHVVLALAS